MHSCRIDVLVPDRCTRTELRLSQSSRTRLQAGSQSQKMNRFDNMNSVDRSRSTQLFFTVTVIVSQAVGLTAVVMTALWLSHFHGGFAWQSNPSKEFNFHPLCMIIGMIFLYGDAILVYRVFRNDRKMLVKILHASLHILALIFAIIGLKTVFDSHNLAKPNAIPNMYSLHSWLGIITVVLFGLQWVFGFASFLLPCLTESVKAFYKPIHVFWGIAVFILAIATSLLGLTEKSIFSNDDYSQKNEEGILVNTLGLTLVLLGFIVVYLVTKDNYRRQPRSDDSSHQRLN